MTPSDEDNQEIEDFIEDWYWDEKSHKFAQNLCRYLFQFIDHLYEQRLSEKTVQKHLDNCWSIGLLECGYGFRAEFSPVDIFNNPDAHYEIEFKRKMSDSNYAIKSYRSTWRKLYKYSNSLKMNSKKANQPVEQSA